MSERIINTDDLIASGEAWQCPCGARTGSSADTCWICGAPRERPPANEALRSALSIPKGGKS